MSTKEQILNRMMTVLMSSTPAGGNVFRSRASPIDRDTSPAIDIIAKAEQRLVFSDQIDKVELTVEVGIFARGDPWDALADPVARQTQHLLMNDALLEDNLVRMLPGTEYEDAEADLTAGVLTQKYRFIYLEPKFGTL